MQILPDRNDFFSKWPIGTMAAAHIGVRDGATSEEIISRCEIREFWLIDAWQERTDAGENPMRQVDHDANYITTKKRFAEMRGVHPIKADAIRAAQIFPNGYFDIVYLDAGCAKDSVALMLETYWRKVCPGGLLCGRGEPYRQSEDEILQPTQERDAAIREFLDVRGFPDVDIKCGGLTSFAIRKR